MVGENINNNKLNIMQTNFILLEDLWSGFFSTIFEVFGIMVGIGIVILILFFLIDSIQHKSKLENFKFEDLQRQITNFVLHSKLDI